MSAEYDDISGEPKHARGADYDGTYVENHCGECGEYESECTCTDSDGCDAPATTFDMAAVHRALADVAALHSVQAAIGKLREARDLLVAAKAPQAANKVRLALTSAQGAERHAWHRRRADERGEAMIRRGPARRRRAR